MKTTVAIRISVIFVLLAVGLAGCSGYQSTPATGTPNPPTGTPNTGGAPTDTQQAGITVVERNNAFSPNTAQVGVGDVVTFTNEDSVFHQVSIGGSDLGRQGQTESVSWTATKPGTFEYVCKIHPTMRGTIVVK